MLFSVSYPLVVPYAMSVLGARMALFATSVPEGRLTAAQYFTAVPVPDIVQHARRLIAEFTYTHARVLRTSSLPHPFPHLKPPLLPGGCKCPCVRTGLRKVNPCLFRTGCLTAKTDVA